MSYRCRKCGKGMEWRKGAHRTPGGPYVETLNAAETSKERKRIGQRTGKIWGPEHSIERCAARIATQNLKRTARDTAKASADLETLEKRGQHRLFGGA